MQRKVKVCHVAKATGVAGSENHLLTLLPGLDKDKYHITFILIFEEGNPLDEYAGQFEKAGVEVKRVAIQSDTDPALIWKLYRLFRVGRYNLVHTHLIHADLYGTLAAKLARVPILVSTKHNDDAFRRHPFFALLNKVASRFMDKIIVISDALRQFAIEVESIEPGKIERIHYGLDAGRFTPCSGQPSFREEFGIDENTPLVGVIARLDPQKGHTYLLQAFRKVVRDIPKAKLLVVGDGPLREELKQQVEDLGLARTVVFTGFRYDVPRIMSDIDLLAVPSLWEGFGLVLLEAMAMEKPIVASNVSAIPEIVVDGETGFLVPPRDERALADAITLLLGSPGLARDMGLSGKARLIREFSIEKMVTATEGLYEEVIAAKID